jgi:hypothetical protein
MALYIGNDLGHGTSCAVKMSYPKFIPKVLPRPISLPIFSIYEKRVKMINLGQENKLKHKMAARNGFDNLYNQFRIGKV